jgi:hypothetical protein
LLSDLHQKFIAQAAAPELEAGNYWLPQTQWAKEFIEECAAFPNAAHDDMVDAWSQAACRFRTSTSGFVDYYRGEAVAQVTQDAAASQEESVSVSPT